jgi:hypothetical protein
MCGSLALADLIGSAGGAGDIEPDRKQKMKRMIKKLDGLDFGTETPLQIPDKWVRSVANAFVAEPFVTAAWRRFLIIAPRAARAIRDATDWIPLLKTSRLAFTRLQPSPPDRTAALRRRKDFGLTLKRIGEIFVHIGQSMDAIEFNQFLLIFAFFVDDKSTPIYIYRVLDIFPRIFLPFMKEAHPNTDDSPRSILMDSKYVLHDVYSCVAFITTFRSGLPSRARPPSAAKCPCRYRSLSGRSTRGSTHLRSKRRFPLSSNGKRSSRLVSSDMLGRKRNRTPGSVCQIARRAWLLCMDNCSLSPRTRSHQSKLRTLLPTWQCGGLIGQAGSPHRRVGREKESTAKLAVPTSEFELQPRSNFEVQTHSMRMTFVSDS